MNEVFSIKIDSRSRFETGQQGGEWLPLPATAEQLHDAMQRVGITADNPHDFFINGFETSIDALNRLTLDNVQKSSMDELNYLAAELSRLDPDELKALNATEEVLEGYSVHQLLEYVRNKELLAQPHPKSVIPLVLNAEQPAEKLKEITERLERGIKEVFESDRYKEYLRVMSKFYNYSFNNTLLIAMQKPDASLIAGFNSWKNQFDRHVKKGEKGIKIIAPTPYKVKKEVEKIDPHTQRPMIGKDGKSITEEKEITIPAFKVVSVFDVSQTEGKELPDMTVDMLTGDVAEYKMFFTALERTAPVPIAFEKIEDAYGYYHHGKKQIFIDEGMSELQTLQTTIHEIAHAKLHNIDLNASIKEQQNRPNRRTREVEAESIAYTVCQHYGLDTSDDSFGYIAGWSSGKELAELKSSLETIRSTAAELINTIDGHITEIQKEHTTTQEQTPVLAKLSPEKQKELSDTVQDAINETAARRVKEANSCFFLNPQDTFAVYHSEQQNKSIDAQYQNYKPLYTGDFTKYYGIRDRLESIWDIFTDKRHMGDDYFKAYFVRGFTSYNPEHQNIDVGDVIAIKHQGHVKCYYCDHLDFVEVPHFFDEAMLKAKEYCTPTATCKPSIREQLKAVDRPAPKTVVHKINQDMAR